jgi:hypothetical protein
VIVGTAGGLWFVGVGFGCLVLRAWGFGVALRSPRWPVLFSERYGYEVPALRWRGWRLFFLSRAPA